MCIYLMQIGGIRFLYDNIVESLKQFNSSPGFGCILAHSMGLGKTLQVIGFIEVFFRCTPAKHVLCVVPVNTLQNWIGEFEHWVPPPPLAASSSTSAAGQSSHSSSSSASGVTLLTNQNPLWGQVTTLATKATPLATATSGTAGGGQSRTDEVRYRTFNISMLSEANRTMDSRLKVGNNPGWLGMAYIVVHAQYTYVYIHACMHHVFCICMCINYSSICFQFLYHSSLFPSPFQSVFLVSIVYCIHSFLCLYF